MFTHQVFTETFEGGSWDKVDRDQNRWLEELAAQGWEPVNLETVPHPGATLAGQVDLGPETYVEPAIVVTVRGMFRRPPEAPSAG